LHRVRQGYCKKRERLKQNREISGRSLEELP
jgi:hypothetical protein